MKNQILVFNIGGTPLAPFVCGRNEDCSLSMVIVLRSRGSELVSKAHACKVCGKLLVKVDVELE